MRMHTKRARVPVDRRRGCMRSIHPDRARDEDLQFFLWISRRSLRALSQEIDELIRPA